MVTDWPSYFEMSSMRACMPLSPGRIDRAKLTSIAWRPGLQTRRSTKFRDVGREERRQPVESRVSPQVLACVVQGTGNVLNVDGIGPRRGLVAERAERL